MPLMIMPGPREPRNFDVYLGPLLEELQELGAPNTLSAMSCLCAMSARAAVFSCPEHPLCLATPCLCCCAAAAVKSGFDLVEHVLEDGVLVPRLLQEVIVSTCIVAADSLACFSSESGCCIQPCSATAGGCVPLQYCSRLAGTAQAQQVAAAFCLPRLWLVSSQWQPQPHHKAWDVFSWLQ